MTTLNTDHPHSVVGGRHPLRYLQGGHGFDAKGNYLGEFNRQGEPLTGAAADPAPTPTPAPDAPQAAAGDEDEADTDLAQLKVADLRKVAVARGIDPAGMKKAELIEALTDGDA